MDAVRSGEAAVDFDLSAREAPDNVMKNVDIKKKNDDTENNN
jgi:hypothetical protein